MLYLLRIVSVVLAAVALVPAGAHLFSLLSKLRLDDVAYLASQRAYDGWNLFGVVVVLSIASTLALAIALYRAGEPFQLVTLALLCLIGTQAIFWIFTYPTNVATQNWTSLTQDWEALRLR